MKQNKLMNVKLTKRGGNLSSQESKHGRCRVCGRPLTDSISIDRGVGPECWSKYSSKRKDNLFDKLKGE